VPYNELTVSSGGSSGGGTVQNRVTNLIQNNKTPAAIAVEQEYPNLFPSGSAASTNASSTITTTTFMRSLKLGMTVQM
jgi:hypothetical protein